MTGRQLISDIKAMSKLITSDALVNDRSIFSEAKSVSRVLIKRETDRRKLFQSPNLFTHLTCIPMTPVPLAECCEYTSELMVARTKEKLPKIAEGIFGLLIQQVSSVDNTIFFKESTARRYANILKLGLPGDKYYWLYNGYGYVSNPDIKAINIFAYFEEDIPTSLLFPQDCDCSTPPLSPCHNPLDDEFKCPGYLEDAVKNMVRDVLLRNYFQLPQDKQSDNLDGQSK